MFVEIQLEAAAAEIENQSRLDAIAERPAAPPSKQPRFFFAADHFQLDAGLAANALDQVAIIPGFARGAGGDGAIGGHVVLVHSRAELAEGARALCDGFVVQQSPRERVVAEANRGAFVIENFDVGGRSGARDDAPDGVRAGVDRREMDGGGHVLAPEVREACEGW